MQVEDYSDYALKSRGDVFIICWKTIRTSIQQNVIHLICVLYLIVFYILITCIDPWDYLLPTWIPVHGTKDQIEENNSQN